ncbi:MAG: hypothetical protein ACJAXJ_000428 [Colwellia sp.]|jgi:hypothetical protein
MSRPLRLEFADALYHITARGNAINLIFLQEDDFFSCFYRFLVMFASVIIGLFMLIV